MGGARLLNMRLPTTYTIIDGVRPDDFPAHIQEPWFVGRMSLERNQARQGAFAAHVNAWRAIQHVGDSGAIVLEDDCIFYRQHRLTSAEYPIGCDYIVGWLFPWGVCETSFIWFDNFLDVIAHLTTGVHELPQKQDKNGKLYEMRWAMCVAYYVPPGMAAMLVCVVENTAKGHVFKSPDAFLRRFVKYFLWPP